MYSNEKKEKKTPLMFIQFALMFSRDAVTCLYVFLKATQLIAQRLVFLWQQAICLLIHL